MLILSEILSAREVVSLVAASNCEIFSTFRCVSCSTVRGVRGSDSPCFISRVAVLPSGCGTSNRRALAFLFDQKCRPAHGAKYGLLFDLRGEPRQILCE